MPEKKISEPSWRPGSRKILLKEDIRRLIVFAFTILMDELRRRDQGEQGGAN